MKGRMPQLAFCEVGNDPTIWLSVAQALRYSAETLWRSHRRFMWYWITSAAQGGASKQPMPAPEVPRVKKEDARAKLGQGSVAVMLMAMSLEAAAKYALLLKGNTVAGVYRLEKGVNTHHLRELFKRAGIPVTPNDADRLDMFTSFLTWRGRYPVPTEDHKLMEAKHGVTTKTLSDFRRLYGVATSPTAGKRHITR